MRGIDLFSRWCEERLLGIIRGSEQQRALNSSQYTSPIRVLLPWRGLLRALIAKCAHKSSDLAREQSPSKMVPIPPFSLLNGLVLTRPHMVQAVLIAKATAAQIAASLAPERQLEM
jgi:hypothetical protein